MNLIIRLLLRILFLPLALLLSIWDVRLPRVGPLRSYRPPFGRNPYRWR